MRLTPPIPLDPANAQIDAYDIAKSTTSIESSSKLVHLRWGKVSHSDMLKYLTTVLTSQIPKDAMIPRIESAKDDGKGTTVERREHLVIRDLDLLPYLVEENLENFKDDVEAAKLGRIVAHADYRFRPKGWHWQDPNLLYEQANGTPIGSESVPKPPGANVKLIEMFDRKVEELLDHHCRDQACFELVNIATNASHLRKGLAKQLVTWLYPFCDEQQLDYKLLASPMGRGLYKSCGFVENEEDEHSAVRVDMREWGGEGIHEHVYMVRHPERRNN